MKYYLDTEFLEGTQKTWWGSKTKPTIDLISIGLVAEDGREYYAISKDFNLKEAWNRYDEVEASPAKKYMGFYTERVYWIRENVLRPIFEEWVDVDSHWANKHLTLGRWEFNYKNFKYFLYQRGKTNSRIAKETKEFCTVNESRGNGILNKVEGFVDNIDRKVSFYGYYCDYDWVVFCWLFGKMINLPEGFPMYCRDLKQMLDEKDWKDENHSGIKDHPNYPKQSNEHSAIHDARWNKELHLFITKENN